MEENKLNDDLWDWRRRRLGLIYFFIDGFQFNIFYFGKCNAKLFPQLFQKYLVQKSNNITYLDTYLKLFKCNAILFPQLFKQ